MIGKTFIKLIVSALTIAAIMASINVALAGGFQISVEAPDSKISGEVRNAVAVVRTFGCHTPSDAEITATAEGIVDGKRQSVPVKLISISNGVYAIKKQWPGAGVWVLAITGTYLGRASSAIVELGPSGEMLARQTQSETAADAAVSTVPRKLQSQEIEAAIKNLASKTSRTSHTAKSAS